MKIQLTQKGCQNSKSISFSKTLDVICVRFHHYFSRQLTLKGSRITSTFSLALYTEKLKNDKIRFLVTKRGDNSTLIFHVNSFWKDLQPKVYFSLAFYAENLKNDKIHFLVTKSGQKMNLISFSDPRPKNCIYFISTFLWKWALHTSSGGGYGSRNF